MASKELKKHWNLSEEAFRALLAWLDGGAESDGASYLEMRRRLVAYFDRKNSSSPEDLADETLNRVARRLEEEGEIRDATPPHFCYMTARFVYLESLRSGGHRERSLEETSGASGRGLTLSAPFDADSESQQKMMGRLEDCLEKLQTGERELILEYYRGERREKIERRRELAMKLGLTLNALAIRAARIRSRLEQCVTGGADDSESTFLSHRSE
jgi:DNA-directed RNA polymerase specialized sigma24 family protein